MVAEGKTNKEVAEALQISVHTVDAHRGRVMDKLNLHSVGETGEVRDAGGTDRLTSRCSVRPPQLKQR